MKRNVIVSLKIVVLEKNGILCSNSTISSQKTSACDKKEWCTGPASEESATIGTVRLCEKGRK